MMVFCFIVLAISLSLIIYSVTIVHRVKNKISEVLDALDDIENGNLNRRILAKNNEIAAPLIYKINSIVISYENKLAAFGQAQRHNRQLMTSLSHDVRTPLTTLIGYLDAVYKGVVSDAERDEYIRIACRKSHDLKDYIDKLFEWFKLNSNEYVMNTDTVEVAELTRNLLIDWIPVLEERQIEYDVSISEQPHFVRIDADGYARVLNNLIQNIVEHSNADNIKFSLCEFENNVKIQLSDNGIGIKPEDLNHIFERMYKCDKECPEKGSGLGLSIAYQLTEKMNGKIIAESKPNEGTLFTLIFPHVSQ